VLNEQQNVWRLMSFWGKEKCVN